MRYELEVELVVPLPGFVKRRAELKIMHTALRELKARVEAVPRRPTRDATRHAGPAVHRQGRRRQDQRRRGDRAALRRRGPVARSCLSTDPAHSLADAFDAELGPLAAPVAGHPNLWGQQLDAQERMEDAWGDIQAYLLEVFDWAGLEGIEAEELSVLPGLDEVFASSDIKTYADSGEWDVVVVDCAPTAETIRLLSLPEILAWYMDRVFPVGRKVNKVVSPILSKVTSLPVADDAVFGAASRFYDRLDGVRELLTDPDTTSVRLVVNPERMVIAEARRTYTYLSLFGYRVDAVVANRLLPDEVVDPWFDRWKAAARRAPRQHRRGVRARAGAAGRAAPRRARRARPAPGPGRRRLRRPRRRGRAARGRAARGRVDPRRRCDVGARRCRSPTTDDLDLGRSGDELLVRVGAYRRVVLLPDSLRRRKVDAAALRDDTLRVSFSAGRAAKAKPTRRRSRSMSAAEMPPAGKVPAKKKAPANRRRPRRRLLRSRRRPPRGLPAKKVAGQEGARQEEGAGNEIPIKKAPRSSARAAN